MWPFDRPKTTPAPGDALVAALTNEQRAVDAIYRRLQLLEGRAEKPSDLAPRVAQLEARLDKELKAFEVEWTSWYDKFRQLYNRLAKRRSRDQEEQDEALEPVTATNGHEAPPDPYQPPSVAPTAHLARRMRSF